MTLMLHVDAKPVEYDELRGLETPPATQTHVSLPHFRLVDLVKTTVNMYGHEVVAEHHGIAEDGARYFGLLSLKSPYTAYEDTVGLRNSHDKSFPIAVGFGSRVFGCDNLAFIADQSIKRRHTANLKARLPGLIGELIEPLALHREAQHRTFERYKHTLLSDERADHAIMQMFREGIINVQRIPDVLHEWEEPSFDDFKDERSAWRLFNAATYALTGGSWTSRKRRRCCTRSSTACANTSTKRRLQPAAPRTGGFSFSETPQDTMLSRLLAQVELQ